MPMRLWHQQHLNTKQKFQRGSEIPSNRNLWPFLGESIHNLATHTPRYGQVFLCREKYFPLWMVTALVQKRLHSLAYVSPLNFTELFRAQKSQQVTIQEAGGTSKLLFKDTIKRENTWIFSSGHFHLWKCVPNSLAHWAWCSTWYRHTLLVYHHQRKI